MAISALFLIATIYAYAVSEDFSTASGRSFLMFTSSLLLVCVSYAFMSCEAFNMQRITEWSVSLGLLFTFLWYNTLAFDIFWTFKNFQAPSESLQRFKFYCLYVCGASLTYISLILVVNKLNGDFFYHLVFFGVFGSIALDVILLLITGCLIFKISKTADASKNASFGAGRDR